MNIIHISPNFNITCGRTKYVLNLNTYLKNLGHNSTIITNGGDLIENINCSTNNIVIVKELFSKNPLKSFIAYKKLLAIASKTNVEIINSHHRFADLIVWVILRKLKSNIRHITTVHSILKKRYYFEYKAPILIAVSNSVKKNLMNVFYINGKKIYVIHNFSTFPVFVKSHEEKLIPQFENEIIILGAGRFSKEKSFDLIIKALNLLKHNYNLHLILIGSGKQEKYYRKAYSNNSKYKFSIIKPSKNIFGLMQRATICILPSRVDPFPTFMLECGILKKPFIGSKVDGIEEIIKDKHNGLLFESGNYRMLTEKISFFLNNPKVMEKCSENLYNTVISNYTADIIIPKIVDLYKNITSPK